MKELYFKLSSPDSEGLTDEEFEEYKTLTSESLNINERKVLKVNSSYPQENIPMGGEMPMNGNAPMGDEIPMDNNVDMGNGESEFDTNFDAGIEADEDEDPKKYIQQLTGKLSQELGKYNNELGEPDIELSKYVGGMIVKQVAKNLDDSGKKELIKKIKTSNSNDNIEEPNLDGTDEENLEVSDTPMPVESYQFSKKKLKQLYEIFNDYNRNEDNLEIKQGIKKNKLNKPFMPPIFKK